MEPFTTDRIIAIVSLVVSVIAVWHTYAVNKSFAKNQLIIDQVKVVSELVNYLNRKKIEIRFTNITEGGNARSSRSGDLTLFELLDPANQLHTFDDTPVLLDSNRCNEPFEFLKYINDPLIPSTIAVELRKFMNGSNFTLKSYSDFADNEVVVLDTRVRYDYSLLQYTSDELRDKLIVGNAAALKSWLSFKSCAEKLRGEIDKWLKSKKIHDLNIRTEFQPY